MRLFLLGLAAGGAIMLAAGTAVVMAPAPQPRDLSGLEGDPARGAYVARLSGCIACHTDIRAGGALLAGGPPIETPFGTFRGPNITPHPEDGIGGWSLDDFALALTAGRAPDGRHYAPAFPFAFYTRMEGQDIADLWAALRSVPPAPGGPDARKLVFGPASGIAIAAWQTAFFEPAPLPPVAGRSGRWLRGRYLALGPGHCGACHTPRNALGARQASARHAGAVAPDGEKIPAITADALAAAGWSATDLVWALRSGTRPDGDVFGGSMAEVVREGTRFWSDDDLAAIAEFLLDPAP